MKRSDLFYIWVAISSYITGSLVYMIFLWTIYGEHAKDYIGRIIPWTAPSFFMIGIPFYFLCTMLLRRINKYSFWLQTFLFALVGVMPVFSVSLFTGFFKFFNVSFLFTHEGILFFSFFFSIAVVCSYGFWLAQKRLNKKPYFIASFLVLILFIIATAI